MLIVSNIMLSPLILDQQLGLDPLKYIKNESRLAPFLYIYIYLYHGEANLQRRRHEYIRDIHSIKSFKVRIKVIPQCACVKRLASP